jgi:hypothetical protein
MKINIAEWAEEEIQVEFMFDDVGKVWKFL